MRLRLVVLFLPLGREVGFFGQVCTLIKTLRASQVCTLTSRLSCGSYARKLFTSSDEAILQTSIQCGC
jgi:hypothetical protein